MFFTNLLEANIRAKKLKFHFTYFPKTQSTNEDIWEIYNREKKDGLFVITDNQTNGKGRHNNSWVSIPSKGITCSFLLSQVFDEINFHSLLIPLAIVKGIKKFTGITLDLKWPNDILYKNKKLAGVLIESKKNKDGYIFNIGIGINVNEETDDFPSYLKNKISSLKIINNKSIQREPLLGCILNELDHLIINADYSQLIKEWMQYCKHINKMIKFKNNNEYVNGIFKNINASGQAVIEHNLKSIIYNGPITLL